MREGASTKNKRLSCKQFIYELSSQEKFYGESQHNQLRNVEKKVLGQ